jgi:hypothetical protein
MLHIASWMTGRAGGCRSRGLPTTLGTGTVEIAVALGQKHQNTKVTPTSTHDNSTNMDLMELAVGATEAQGEGE